ncbi:MAG: hypothetical protein ACRD28_04870 [Acidobacteriaceae bacterium]
MPMCHGHPHLRSFIVLPIFTILLGWFGLAPTAPAASDLGQFPAIHARSLDGVHLNLPAKFCGRISLVVISFAREQQKEVKSWIPAAQNIEAGHGNFCYYELLVMSRENLLYRLWLNGSLRSNTTDKELRSRILTAYVNKGSFRHYLHIANEKRVVAVLVDREGRVYWRADGAYADRDTPAIVSALAANGS